MNDRISVGQAGLNGRRHALYRFFDSSDVLLYVGITVDIGARFKKHRGDKPWWDRVDHIGIEHFDTRKEAEAAERLAIQKEQPLHNVVHNMFVESTEKGVSNDDLACEIVYGQFGIDFQSEQHRQLVLRARESAKEDEREFGDTEAEVASLLVSDLLSERWEQDYQNFALLSAVPKKDLSLHRERAKESWNRHGVDEPPRADIDREVIRRLAGELAWMYLGRLDHEGRRYFLNLAQTHNVEDSSIPIEAIKYYQHHLDGKLQQVLESEGRALCHGFASMTGSRRTGRSSRCRMALTGCIRPRFSGVLDNLLTGVYRNVTLISLRLEP